MSKLNSETRLLAIEATQEVIGQLYSRIAHQQATRDALIFDALAENTPYRTLQKLTGLPRSALIKIQNSPRRSAVLPVPHDA